MRKLIELNYEDVIALIAEKYGVCPSAISACCITNGHNELVDMDTLTVTVDITEEQTICKAEPVAVPEPPAQDLSFITDIALKVAEEKEKKEAEEKEKKKAEETKPPYPWDDDPEVRYHHITDGILLAWLQGDGTIKQLAEKFKLTDKKYIYRLNDRVKRLRLEGASIPNRRRGRRSIFKEALTENEQS